MNQTNLALKKLQGIKPKGVKTKDLSKLDNLLFDYRDFVDHCDSVGMRNQVKMMHLGTTHYPQRKDFFVKHDIVKEDTENFIKLVSDLDLDDAEAFYTGLYSGLLLSHLTELERKKGSSAKIYFNGHGRKFDYLFARAPHVDKLIVDNFCGNNILLLAGNTKSSTDYVLVNNLSGSNNLGVVDFGNIDLLIATNCKGDELAADAIPMSSKVGMLIADNIEGNFALSSVGFGGGACGIAIVNNIRGNGTLGDFGASGGLSNLVYAQNIVGSHILYESKGSPISEAFDYPLNLVLCKNIAGSFAEKRRRIDKLVEFEKDPIQFDEITKKYRINEVLNQINSIKTVDESTFDILDKIQRVYLELKPNLKYLENKKRYGEE
ncbi:hypothetical protein HOK51_07995 [Candidatus Woesearchaeota archaeon]|jgi:hypothetical protein|nr:hypothetical protein [Candidatus Woesearchaeota archaeon]MBT6519767.1 hypothetical protein [Candidatus Woesearchaeota archaeon]MBT7368146.1 hypothetical protein [Candidatus Woesearchaeota archaeon]